MHRKQQKLEALACGLGVFSIGLGLMEVLAPKKMAKELGLNSNSPRVIKLFGMREIATGVAILGTRGKYSAPVWGRVAGDALDLAFLAQGLSPNNRKRENVMMAMLAVAGVTALDMYCAACMRPEKKPSTLYNYSHRSGFPKLRKSAQGAARDFKVPEDFRIPELLRPWPTAPHLENRRLH